MTIAVATFVADLLGGFPLTGDLGAWNAHATLIAAGTRAALTLWGGKVSLAGRSAFGDPLARTAARPSGAS